MQQSGKRLHVETDTRPAAGHDLDVDLAGVGQDDRAVRQIMGRNGHQHPPLDAGMQDRPAGRQRVGGRAGGRADDQAPRNILLASTGMHIGLRYAFEQRAKKPA